jgi:hypothetical protein
LIFVIMKMEAISSSETSFLTRVTRRNIPEDGVLSFGSCRFVVIAAAADYVCQ